MKKSSEANSFILSQPLFPLCLFDFLIYATMDEDQLIFQKIYFLSYIESHRICMEIELALCHILSDIYTLLILF